MIKCSNIVCVALAIVCIKFNSYTSSWSNFHVVQGSLSLSHFLFFIGQICCIFLFKLACVELHFF